MYKSNSWYKICKQIEAIKFSLEQMDLSPAELIDYVGYKSRISELLSGKRKLTLPMIRTLHEKLKIPADILIKEYLTF